MSGKEALRRGGAWKKHLSKIVAGAALLAAAVAARHLMGPGDSHAQSPATGRQAVRRQAAPQQPVRRQAARPQATRQAPRRAPAAAAARRPAASNPAAQASAQAAPQTSIRSLKTMAIVNGQSLSRDLLARECLLRYGGEVLESLVNKHLIWQACQQRGIKITEQDVNDEIDRVASKFGLPLNRWLTLLQEERNISPDKYRREIIWPTLALRALASDQIAVTPEELQKAMETEYGPSIKARMISVKSRSKAEQLLKAARQNPENFGELAKEHSEDPNTASARGLIPPIRRHVGDRKIEQVAFGLQKGEVSPIIPAAGQYIILKCEEVRPEQYVPTQQLEKVRQRLTDRVRDQKLSGAASELFQKLQAQAQVVNVFNNPQLRKQQPGVAATINGKPITMKQLTDECLDRHGADVLEGEINRAILAQELNRRNLKVTQQALDAEVARAADAYGYLKDGKPDVDGWLTAIAENEGAMKELYIRDAVWPSVALKELVSGRVKVTNEDLQKGFESNYGERVEVQAIVFANQRQAQKVWTQAKANNTEEFFGQLAYQYSIEPVSRGNYGRVPAIRRHSGHDALEQEAFRLQTPGELSAIVNMGDKFVVMRYLGRTKPNQNIKLADVRDDLHKDILERRTRVEMAKEFDRLHDQAKIVNYVAQLTQPRQQTASRQRAAR